MPEPAHNFPFAYRLPTDVAARIHGTAAVDTPLWSRARPGVARRESRPGWVVDAFGDVTRDGNWLC
jgi:hypothetical protein